MTCTKHDLGDPAFYSVYNLLTCTRYKPQQHSTNISSCDKLVEEKLHESGYYSFHKSTV